MYCVVLQIILAGCICRAAIPEPLQRKRKTFHLADLDVQKLFRQQTTPPSVPPSVDPDTLHFPPTENMQS